MRKRLCSALLCLVVAAVMLAGCGSKEKSADSAPDADTSETKTSDTNELLMGVSSSVTNLNKHLGSSKEGWLMLGAL